MSTIACLNCRATTTNGLALCDLCQRWVRSALEFLPVYFRNLARWKPGRAGSRPVPGSRVLYDGPAGPGGDRIERALDEAHHDLSTWAQALEEDRPGLFAMPDWSDDQAAWVRAVCADFDQYLITIATTDWCGEFLRGLERHERALRALTEDVAPGWYAGACRRCEHPTHVVPGLTWVTCGGCGATTYARDHLDVVLSEARGWVAPPRRMAEAIVALVDTETSVQRLDDRIRQWGKRGKLVVHRAADREGDEVGPKRYWFGEVLDRLASEGQTRSADVAEVGRAS